MSDDPGPPFESLDLPASANRQVMAELYAALSASARRGVAWWIAAHSGGSSPFPLPVDDKAVFYALAFEDPEDQANANKLLSEFHRRNVR